MIPFSTEKLSVGRPAMFQALIWTWSPSVLLRENSVDVGIPIVLTSVNHSLI